MSKYANPILLILDEWLGTLLGLLTLPFPMSDFVTDPEYRS